MIVDLHKTDRSRHWWTSMVACLILFLLLSAPASTSAASAISQGFQTNNTEIVPGSLLSLTSAQGGVVEPSTSSNVAGLVGVASTKSLIELSGSGKNIQVVVSGLTQALVSNINGDIHTGDKITTSPFAGIGMKATSPTEIVGTAQANLSSVKTVRENVTDKKGKKQNITVGDMPIEVSIAYFSANQNGSSIFVPAFLQSIANSVAGSQVSPLRVLTSALVLVLGFTTVCVILYTSIRTSITAIGRNPLANRVVRKGLVDVLVMATGILTVTIITVYAIVGLK